MKRVRQMDRERESKRKKELQVKRDGVRDIKEETESQIDSERENINFFCAISDKFALYLVQIQDYSFKNKAQMLFWMNFVSKKHTKE